MLTQQSSLGAPAPHRAPRFDQAKLGIVSGVKNASKGRVEVRFRGDRASVPVRILHTGISVDLTEGDWVVVGFLDGNKNDPYIIGVVAGKFTLEGMFKITKDVAEFTLPVKLKTVENLEEKLADLEDRLQAVEQMAHTH